MGDSEYLEEKSEGENPSLIPKDLFKKSDLAPIYGACHSFARFTDEWCNAAVNFYEKNFWKYCARMHLRTFHVCAEIIYTAGICYGLEKLFNS